MWECHTGQPIWHVTHRWELRGFDWVLSISFVLGGVETVVCRGMWAPRLPEWRGCGVEKLNVSSEEGLWAKRSNWSTFKDVYRSRKTALLIAWKMKNHECKLNIGYNNLGFYFYQKCMSAFARTRHLRKKRFSCHVSCGLFFFFTWLLFLIVA